MVLAAVDELEQAALTDRAHRVEGEACEFFLVVLEVVEIGAGDARHGAGEAQLDDFLVQADALEQLRAAIAGDGGDAHLGQDLEQALVGALAVVGQRFVPACMR